MKKPCRPADICAHLGDDYDRYLGAIVPPLFQNTLFTRKHEEHGYSYSRINNPTIEILEKKLAALEHAPAARVFASGMAAITATLSSLLHSGGHVLALRSAYHPVIGFLDTEMKKYGVEVTYLERFTPEEIERSLRPNTRVFYLESPSSNIFRVLPLREIAAQAHACGAVTVIDNTWATPLYQKPLELGIDYSIHSATKYLGGHSDIIGGVLVSKDETLMKRIREQERALYGGIIGPMEAWLVIRGIRTLPARLAIHQENAMKVASYLEQHPKVKQVFYTGLKSNPQRELIEKQQIGHTGLLSFIIDAPVEKVPFFIDQLSSTSDPRMAQWVRIVGSDDVHGVVSGVVEPDGTGASVMNPAVLKQYTTPVWFMTSSELFFILSEAAHTGMIPGGEAAAEA